MHYFKTVKDVGTTEAKAVMAKMKELPINDFMTTSGRIREDGRVIRDMYLLETKKPSESTGEWDLIRSSALCPSQIFENGIGSRRSEHSSGQRGRVRLSQKR